MPKFIYPEGFDYEAAKINPGVPLPNGFAINCARNAVDIGVLPNQGQGALCASVIAYLLKVQESSLDMDTSAADVGASVITMFRFLNAIGSVHMDKLAEAVGGFEATKDMEAAGIDDIIPLTPCAFCGKENGGGKAFNGDRAIRPGDMALCVHCRNVSLFDENMGLRKPTDDEADQIALHPAMRKVKAALEASDQEPQGHA